MKGSEDGMTAMLLLELMKKMGSNKGRSKETEPKLGMIHDPTKFLEWTSKSRASIAASLGRGDRGLKWAMEVERNEEIFDILGTSGSKYMNFDIKLATEVIRVVTGDLQREIIQESNRLAQTGKLLRGRQALWMVHRWFRIAAEAGMLYDLADLMKVSCLRENGGAKVSLASFSFIWDGVLDRM